MAIANLAMATGNIGRPGVGVNPLRGQNNVQGACDMGSFPHELSGYRHVSDAATRGLFEKEWDCTIDSEPGLRIPNMLDAAVEGTFRALYIQGEDILQSDPDHDARRGRAGGDGLRGGAGPVPERDGELRARLPAGLDLPREGRDLHQRRAADPADPQGDGAEERLRRLGDHAADRAGGGARLELRHPSEIMDEIARLTPTFAGVTYEKLDAEGSIQWPCNEEHPLGFPVMHTEEFTRGQGRFMLTEYVPTDERTGPRYPLILTTGRILSQYNVGAQTRRTDNVVWHEEDRLEIHPHDAEQRGIIDGELGDGAEPGRRDRPAGADHRPGGAGGGLHHLPPSDDAGERGDHRLLGLGDQLPGVQGDGGAGDAVERPDRRAGGLSRLQRALAPDRRGVACRCAEPLARVTATRVAGEARRPMTRMLPEEVPVALIYDGTTHAVMMASPADLEDFAVGFSLTEGKVAAAGGDRRARDRRARRGHRGADVAGARGGAADASTRRRAMLGPTGCGLCGIDSLEAALPAVPAVGRGPSLSRGRDRGGGGGAQAGAAAECAGARAARGGLLDAGGRAGGGARGCRAGTMRSTSWSGRWCATGVDPADGVVVLTSRLSVEMVQKVAALGASVVAAVSAPTALALRTAEAAGHHRDRGRPRRRVRGLHPPRPDRGARAGAFA